MMIEVAASDEEIKDARSLSSLTLTALTIGLFIISVWNTSLITKYLEGREIPIAYILTDLIALLIIIWMYPSMLVYLNETYNDTSVKKRYGRLLNSTKKLPKVWSHKPEIKNGKEMLSITFLEKGWHLPAKFIVSVESIKNYLNQRESRQSPKMRHFDLSDSSDATLLNKLMVENPDVLQSVIGDQARE